MPNGPGSSLARLLGQGRGQGSGDEPRSAWSARMADGEGRGHAVPGVAGDGVTGSGRCRAWRRWRRRWRCASRRWWVAREPRGRAHERWKAGHHRHRDARADPVSVRRWGWVLPRAGSGGRGCRHHRPFGV